MKQTLAPAHTCECLGSARMSEGRSFWVGRLLTPYIAPDGTAETHCLHLTTKRTGEVVFFFIEADFEWLVLLSARAIGVEAVRKWLDTDEVVRARTANG